MGSRRDGKLKAEQRDTAGSWTSIHLPRRECRI